MRLKNFCIFFGLSLSSACVGETGSLEVSQADFAYGDGFEDGASDSALNVTQAGSLQLGQPATGTISLAYVGTRLSTATSKRFIAFEFASAEAKNYQLELNNGTAAFGKRVVVQQKVENVWRTIGSYDGTSGTLSQRMDLPVGQVRFVVSAINAARDQGEFQIKLSCLSCAEFQTSFQVQGTSIAISPDEKWIAVGDTNDSDGSAGVMNEEHQDRAAAKSGAVRIYRIVASELQLAAFIKAENSLEGQAFGSSLAWSPDSKTLAVGSPEERGRTVAGETDLDAVDALALGGSNRGAVYVYRVVSEAPYFAFSQYLKSTKRTDFGFGISVALTRTSIAVSMSRRNGLLGQVAFEIFPLENGESRALSNAIYSASGIVRTASLSNQSEWFIHRPVDSNNFFTGSENSFVSSDGSQVRDFNLYVGSVDATESTFVFSSVDRTTSKVLTLGGAIYSPSFASDNRLTLSGRETNRCVRQGVFVDSKILSTSGSGIVSCDPASGEEKPVANISGSAVLQSCTRNLLVSLTRNGETGRYTIYRR